MLETDLKPFQTFYLLQSKRSLTPVDINRLMTELIESMNADAETPDERVTLEKQEPARSLGKEMLSWVTYKQTPRVSWAIGSDAPHNTLYNLIVLVALGKFLAVVTTDKTLGLKLSRTHHSAPHWSQLSLATANRLTNAVIEGQAKTLWLSGIHRSVSVKADSKVLIGRDLAASLDALGDQTYQFTSTRCAGPANLFSSKSTGVTPRAGKVWLGPSSSWQSFVKNAQLLLARVDAASESICEPYPVLASQHSDLKHVTGAFDIGLAPPEYLFGEDPQSADKIEDLASNAAWEVQAKKGANCVVEVKWKGEQFRAEISLVVEESRITHDVQIANGVESHNTKEFLEICRRPDVLKVFYESLHTYSDGAIFEVRTRSLPFACSPADFSKFDVTMEKPVDEYGNADLTKIGAKEDRSLFTWVWKRFKQGWLWCDDGSGEIADFIHLDSAKRRLSLIHVKGAHSSSPARQISVSAYEVVCSQALKNLRYTERANLEKPLKQKIEREARIVRGWRNGLALKHGSQAFWNAIAGVRYSDLVKSVIVVQPHTRQSMISTGLTQPNGKARQASLLFTLLHGIKADVNRYGAEFEVIIDR